jgi:hypothetical protein
MANALFMVLNPSTTAQEIVLICLSGETGSQLPGLNFGKLAAKCGFAAAILMFFAGFWRSVS